MSRKAHSFTQRKTVNPPLLFSPCPIPPLTPSQGTEVDYDPSWRRRPPALASGAWASGKEEGGGRPIQGSALASPSRSFLLGHPPGPLFTSWGGECVDGRWRAPNHYQDFHWNLYVPRSLCLVDKYEGALSPRPGQRPSPSPPSMVWFDTDRCLKPFAAPFVVDLIHPVFHLNFLLHKQAANTLQRTRGPFDGVYSTLTELRSRR